jgi:hypothetical protein
LFGVANGGSLLVDVCLCVCVTVVVPLGEYSPQVVGYFENASCAHASLIAKGTQNEKQEKDS